jgi:hypothetical protein
VRQPYLRALVACRLVAVLSLLVVLAVTWPSPAGAAHRTESRSLTTHIPLTTYLANTTWTLANASVERTKRRVQHLLGSSRRTCSRPARLVEVNVTAESSREAIATPRVVGANHILWAKPMTSPQWLMPTFLHVVACASLAEPSAPLRGRAAGNPTIGDL